MAHENQYFLSDMFELLKVSSAGFYEWKNRKESNRSIENRKLAVSIKAFYHESQGTYGAIRICDDLKDIGVKCSKNRVARIMASENIKSVHKQKFKICTTDSKHSLPVANNVISQDFTVKGPNEKWGCDITYIPTGEGFLFLAIVMDFYSRKIIGFAIDDNMKADLCARALMMALVLRNPPKTLIHHSDRGSQYASHLYVDLIKSKGFIQSMSRRGNCYDNAMVESFFHTLKVELVHRKTYATKLQAKEDIEKYIHHFYNSKRKHSALDYQAPNKYELNNAA